MLKQHISLVLVYVVLGPPPASPWQEKKKVQNLFADVYTHTEPTATFSETEKEWMQGPRVLW